MACFGAYHPLEMLQSLVHLLPQASHEHDNHADIIRSCGVCTQPAQIRPATTAKYCALVSLNATKGKASLFPHSPGQLAPEATTDFKFWLFCFSPIPVPASEVPTSTSATSIAGN